MSREASIHFRSDSIHRVIYKVLVHDIQVKYKLAEAKDASPYSELFLKFLTY